MANITEEFLGSAGLLQIQNGVVLDSTLRVVTDQLNNSSTLYLSRDQVKIGRVSNNTPLALFGTQNVNAIISTANISGSEKTFTFPNSTMTFAGINIAQTFTAAQTFNSPSASDTDGSPIRILTNPWTTGNGNQNHPLLLFGPHGGNIWAASPNGGTYIGINAVASFPGNFLDFHVNGGASLFRVSSAGTVTGTNFNVTGIGGRYSFDNSQYIDGTTFSNVIFHRSNANGHRFNVNGTDILNILSTGLTSSNNIAVSGKVTSTGGYIGTSGNIIPSFESSVSYGAASGNANFRPISISYSISNTGLVSGTATGIFLHATEGAVSPTSGLNGMGHALIDLQSTISGVTTSKFKVSSGGLVNTVTMAAQNSACNRYSDSSSGSINWAFVNSTTAAVVYQTTGLYSALSTDVINTSAIFELRSTTKGFLPPVMTTTQKNAISSPATGLVLFDSTLGKLCVYGGAAWQTITSA